jgi:hypothetical protein
MCASFLGISGALDLDVLEQPANSDFFGKLLDSEPETTPLDRQMF